MLSAGISGRQQTRLSELLSQRWALPDQLPAIKGWLSGPIAQHKREIRTVEHGPLGRPSLLFPLSPPPLLAWRDRKRRRMKKQKRGLCVHPAAVHTLAKLKRLDGRAYMPVYLPTYLPTYLLTYEAVRSQNEENVYPESQTFPCSIDLYPPSFFFLAR
jgi:hypothetical protein